METSNLALAAVAVGIVALVFRYEWMLTIRGKTRMRPQSQMPFAKLMTDGPSKDSEGNDSTQNTFCRAPFA